jgi:hypothetical protein
MSQGKSACFALKLFPATISPVLPPASHFESVIRTHYKLNNL